MAASPLFIIFWLAFVSWKNGGGGGGGGVFYRFRKVGEKGIRTD